MGLRAKLQARLPANLPVLAALAVCVCCVSGAAEAANYAEVWNPPEASGHAVKPSKKPAASAKAGARANAPAKPTGSKTTTHPPAKKVAGSAASKTAPKHPAAHQTQTRTKAPLTTQTKKPHPQAAAQTKATATTAAPGKPAHTKPTTVAAHGNFASNPAPTASANNSRPLNSSANKTDPATANSGSLPPILH